MSIEVSNPAVARTVFELARVGFRGTATEIAAAGGLAITGQVVSASVRQMVPVFAKLGIELEFENKGNNKFILIPKCKTKKVKTPDFAQPQDVAAVVTGVQSSNVNDLHAEIEH